MARRSRAGYIRPEPSTAVKAGFPKLAGAENWIGADVDLRQVMQGFESLQRAGSDARPVFRQMRRPIRKEHRERTGGPNGPWPPLSASTRERLLKRKDFTKKGRVRKRAQRRLDNQLGKLKVALDVTVQPSHLTVRSKAGRGAGSGATHQHGGTAARGIRIPQREFVWISPEATEKAAELLVEHCVRAYGEGR